MSFNLGSSIDTGILIDDDSASEHESEVFHTALEHAIIPKQEEDVEVEIHIEEMELGMDNPFVGDEMDRDISMIVQPANDQLDQAEAESWSQDDFKRDVVCGTPAINEEAGERRFVYWDPPSVTQEQESPFLFYPPASPPRTPPQFPREDVIVLSGPESEVEALVEEVKTNTQAEGETAAPKKRKRATPRAPRVPPVPIYRYAAGKMNAREFVAASNTLHLVIEQEGNAGRIGRALLEFDLKPREFATGSYGWSGACQGGLPAGDKGMVQVRCMVNLIVKGSKPIQVNKPLAPVKRT